MISNKLIYFDNNATTPVDQRVLDAMLPYFNDLFANAGSAHLFGLEIAETVEKAQRQTANLIGAKPQEIIFTSGATEAINQVIKGFSKHPKKHIVTFATEHKAVLDSCAFMEMEGLIVSYLPINTDGSFDLNAFESALTNDTCLVCAMLANNETGVLNPIDEIARICHKNGVLLFCDATQAVGKIVVNVKTTAVDFMAFSAHKFYGPKGIGALYISPRAANKPDALIHGGGQQRNRRSGTLNVPGIVAMGKACEISQIEMTLDSFRIGELRDQLENGLLKIGDSFVNGDTRNRIYNTSNICFKRIDSDKLILLLKGISVSNGAACSAISTEPSHVLTAMGLSDADALASIRFSLGRFNTLDEIETVIRTVTTLVEKLRN